MRRTLLAASLALASSAPAHAGLALNAAWQHERERETDLPASGYGVGMSIDLGRHAYAGVNYSSLRTDSFEDAEDAAVGRLEYRSGGVELGTYWPWTDRLGLSLAGGYAESSIRGLDGFQQDRIDRLDGPTGYATLSYRVGPRLDFNVGRGYSYLGARPGWDSSAGLGLRLWRELWLDGGYWRGEGSEGWNVGVRTAIADR